MIWFGSGKTRLKVTVNDPTIEVTFRGSQLSIKDGASQVDVEPGDQELTIRVAGVEFQTPKFSLKKGTTSIVEVERAENTLAVNLAGTELAAWPLDKAATASPATATQSVTPTAAREGEIDLLAAVDVSQLGDSDMKWERKGQTVVCTGTGAAGKSAWKGFRLPTEIGGDYEVELDFQQRAFWPMQIDFPLQDTVLRVSLTGDYCDLMIEDDKTQPNAEKTWRSRAATLKTMVPQKLVVRVRQSGTRAEIEATLDGVTLGTYSGERSRLVLPSWVNPNFKQITSGSLCGNLAEGYIELRRAVYRPLTNSASNPPPAVAPAKDSISTGTVRPAQLPSDAGLPLRWLSLSVHDPSVFDAAANLANGIEDRSWQLHGDALTRKARQRGVPTIVSFHRKEFIEFLAGRAPEFETKLHAFVGANRDVIAGVNFLSPYTNDARECIEHVGPFGRRLKAAFPGLSYWVSYIESPAGWTGPLPVIPPEVDVVEMQTYYAMTPLMVQEHFDQHLPTWKALANGRPQTFRWVTAQLDGAPKVLKTESGTVDRVLTTSGRLGLTGVVLDHFGGREDGWSPPLESDTTALSELTKYSHRYGYGTREKHSENALMSQLSDTESGWTDLFNGRDLTGWSGLTGYWKWSNGELVGTLPAPLTQRNTVLRHDRTFRDFEIEYEMKLEGNPGNSGLQIRSELMDPAIFLASGPQVDAGGAHWGGLSGELFGDTIMRAAKPAGTIKLNDYNKFHVRCVGKHITITLNGSVTVDGDFPTIADEGILGWQLHGRVPSTVRLRNVRIRELNTPAMAAVAAPSPDTPWTDLFNGRDLTGWTPIGVQGWRVENGVLIGEAQDAPGWLMSNADYDNFEFDFEYRIGSGTISGIFLRAWPDGPLSGKEFWEVQVMDEMAEAVQTLTASQRTGALYNTLDARPLPDLRPNLWHRMNIAVHNQDIRVTVNGQEVTRGKLPAGKQPHGHLGLQLHKRTNPQRCEFQKLRVRPLKDGLPAAPAMAQAPENVAPDKPVDPDAGKVPMPDFVLHGLKAEIFEGRNFERKVGEQIEPSVECFWELGAPSKDAPVDNFSVRFTGWLRAPKTGRYKLMLHSKDGSRLKINHRTVIDSWRLAPELAEVSLELSQDPQPIEVEVFHSTLQGWASLLWQPAGTATICHVPASALFPDLESAQSKGSRSNLDKTGLVAEYFDKTFSRRLATDRVYRIEEIWGHVSPRWGLPRDSGARYTGILVPPVSGPYKFVTAAREHIRVWIDDKPTVEAKGISPSQNAVVELEANKPYEIRVEILTSNHGAHYVHWIPPGTTKEVSIPPGCLFPNKAAVKLAQSPKVTSKVPADGPLVPGKWIDLFNGRDLTGWEVVNDKGIFPNTMDAGWSVIDGTIQCQSPDHGWLRSVREFEDFDLELKCRFPGPQKSSLILRTRGPIAPLADGLWVDLQHGAAGGVALAKIESQPRLLPSGEWNQLRIEARGTKFHVEVNGQTSADADLATHQWAASLEQAGRIGLNNYKGQANGIAFRDIRIRPVLRTAPSTISAAERETIERGLAKLKADDEAAEKKLLKAFDEQIEKVRSAPKLSADERVVKIKSLEDEKALFEKHAQIPFSLAVRTETLKYLREFTEARTDAAKVYDKLIESLTKQKKDELASLMRTERDIAVGPKVLATWQTTEVNGGKKADWSIWSDGSVGKPDRQFLWMMDERRFVIQWRKDPPWVAAFDIQPDSLKADVYNEQRVHVIRAVRAAP